MASAHDDKHRALRGSECQIQLYVNSPERRKRLDSAILKALPTLAVAGATSLDWRSPLAKPLFATDHPFHEYRDGKVFQAIDRPDLLPAWRVYWPSRSQKWDAIAVARDQAGHSVGPVLVEAKSYPREFRDVGGGSDVEGDRRDVIAKRLQETRHWLGIDETEELADRWLGELFQSANRFATLHFFRHYTHLKGPEPAWLANIYFVDDKTHLSSKRATSSKTWDAELPLAEADLGLACKHVEHSGRVFLDAGTYAELVDATGG